MMISKKSFFPTFPYCVPPQKCKNPCTTSTSCPPFFHQHHVNNHPFDKDVDPLAIPVKNWQLASPFGKGMPPSFGKRASHLLAR